MGKEQNYTYFWNEKGPTVCTGKLFMVVIKSVVWQTRRFVTVNLVYHFPAMRQLLPSGVHSGTALPG